MSEKMSNYMRQTNHFLDIYVILVNGLTLCLHATNAVSLTLIRQLAAIGVLGIWMQMYFWFRLFDSLAQYVDLIGETISDIRHFIYVFLELMAMFMVVFYML